MKYIKKFNENELLFSQQDNFRDALKILLYEPNKGLSLMLRGKEEVVDIAKNAFIYSYRGNIKKTFSVDVITLKSKNGIRYIVDDDGLIIAAAFVDNNNTLTGIITENGFENVGIGQNLLKFIQNTIPSLKIDGVVSKAGKKLLKKSGLLKEKYSWEILYNHKYEHDATRWIKYKDIIDEVEYEVEFVTDDEKTYFRNFEIYYEYARRIHMDPNEIIEKFKPNAFRVFKCISEITIEFIKKFNPEKIIIEHVGEAIYGKLSQRALASYKFLKDKTNYTILYMAGKRGSTICYTVRA